jgi:hypothetical protein
MAKKKQSIHDHFSAQLGLQESSHDAQFTEEDGLYAPMDAVEGAGDSDMGDEYDAPVAKKSRVEKKSKATRLRGPLDGSLTKGAYDAVPVSMSEFESTNIDDIFGMLDEGERRCGGRRVRR